MEKIKLGFSKPNKWMPYSWLIMVGYNIPYSHVYIKFHSDKYERDLIYQASHTIVNFVGNEVFIGSNIVLKEFEFEISPENRLKMIQFAMDNAGKPYGLKQVFGMALVRIADIFGKKIKNPFKDKGKTYVCSELCAYILENYLDKKILIDIDEITPKDLYEYFTALENT